PEQTAEIELDALAGVKLRGTLRLVLPTADRRKATVPVRVALTDPPPRLRPDMSARVTFVKPVSPEAAVVESASIAVLPPPPPSGGAHEVRRIALAIVKRAYEVPRF